MECGAKEESEKKIRRKRGRGKVPTLSPLSHPVLVVVVVFFSAQMSLRCPHDLNAWNRLIHFGCGGNRQQQLY